MVLARRLAPRVGPRLDRAAGAVRPGRRGPGRRGRWPPCPGRWNAVDAEDVRRVCRAYLSPERVSMVVSGDKAVAGGGCCGRSARSRSVPSRPPPAGPATAALRLDAFPTRPFLVTRPPSRLHCTAFMTVSFRELRAQRLNDEVGTLHKQADLPVALVYPSPYHVGMSSLGYQTIYRELNALPGVSAERAFLPDDVAEARRRREPLCHLRVGPADRRVPGGRVLAGLRAGDRRPGRLPRPGGHPGAGQRAGAVARAPSRWSWWAAR